MIKSFDISIDTKKETANQIYNINSNDFNVVTFNITITESRIPKNLTEATAVRLAVKKPDGKTVFQDGTITDATKGKVVFTLNTQSLILPGKHVAEVMIYKTAAEILVTDDFVYEVNKGILNDKTLESLNEWSVLNKLILDTDTARESTITATTNANTATTNANKAKDDAITATTNANNATTAANTATTNANNAATGANTAKTNADTATAAANTAKTNADTATTAANTAAGTANTAATNANNVANTLVHKGDYSAATAYVPRNVVTYLGASYMNIVGSTGVLPTDTTKWKVVSSKGDTGPQGPDGPAGPTGPVATKTILENLTADPTSPEIGRMWLRTDL